MRLVLLAVNPYSINYYWWHLVEKLVVPYHMLCDANYYGYWMVLDSFVIILYFISIRNDLVWISCGLSQDWRTRILSLCVLMWAFSVLLYL